MNGTADNNEPINLSLKTHQTTLPDWDLSQAIADLHLWAERGIVEFKLEIGVPALMVDRLRRTRLGHFRYGRNPFGIKDEVAINKDHLRQSEYWAVIGTLVHELLHSWQNRHGKPSFHNHHNRQFRQKASALGLIVNSRGCTQYQPGDTPFMNFLKKYGVTPPDLPQPHPIPVPPSKSKLHLYECQCPRPVKVRVGRSTFNAMCLDCGKKFELKS